MVLKRLCVSMKSHLATRRTFLALATSSLAGSAIGSHLLQAADPKESQTDDSDLISSIEKVVLLRGRDGSGPTWFHPRACMVPGETGKVVFMTLQEIAGSDYFGPVHWM